MRGAGAHHPGVFRHVDRGDLLVDPLVLLVIDYLRSAHRGHLLGLACGITASCPGVRSAGTRPGILTGVLEATLRDPQVTTPAPSYDPGSHSKKSRRRGQPAPTVPIPHGGTNPGRTRQRPSPPRPAPASDFHAARPSPDEMATMVIAVPFRVEGWHAPAGRRTREPRSLPRPGRSDRQRRWVPGTGTRPASR